MSKQMTKDCLSCPNLWDSAGSFLCLWGQSASFKPLNRPHVGNRCNLSKPHKPNVFKGAINKRITLIRVWIFAKWWGIFHKNEVIVSWYYNHTLGAPFAHMIQDNTNKHFYIRRR